MTAITITAEQAAHAREHGVLVVEGELCHTVGCSWGTARPKSGDCRCKGTIVAPVALTALMGDCDVCAGTGLVDSFSHTGDAGCPRDTGCGGLGYQALTVKVQCDCACHRLHSKYPGLSHDVLGQCKRDGSCRDGIIDSFTCRVERIEPSDDGRYIVHVSGFSAWVWQRSAPPSTSTN